MRRSPNASHARSTGCHSGCGIVVLAWRMDCGDILGTGVRLPSIRRGRASSLSAQKNAFSRKKEAVSNACAEQRDAALPNCTACDCDAARVHQPHLEHGRVCNRSPWAAVRVSDHASVRQVRATYIFKPELHAKLSLAYFQELTAAHPRSCV